MTTIRRRHYRPNPTLQLQPNNSTTGIRGIRTGTEISNERKTTQTGTGISNAIGNGHRLIQTGTGISNAIGNGHRVIQTGFESEISPDTFSKGDRKSGPGASQHLLKHDFDEALEVRPEEDVDGEALEVRVFLPTGIFLTISSNASTTLAQLKKQVFDEAHKWPLRHLLLETEYVQLRPFLSRCM